MPRRVYAGAWPRIRLRVLERDNRLCQIRLDVCTVVATCVDHIVPIELGGAWWDETNLRAACQPCNQKRVGAAAPHRWRAAATEIVLVVGPPGADIGGYARRHAAPADLIVDDDILQHSVGPAGVGAARSALVERLRRGAVAAPRAWLTSHDPMADASLPHHRTVVVEQGGAGGSAPPSTTDSDADQAWRRIRRGETDAATASREW